MQRYFEPSCNCRQVFIDSVMKRANIVSVNQLGEYYACYNEKDSLEAVRQIRRVRKGKHEISDKLLAFLASLVSEPADEVLVYVEYYLSRYGGFQQQLIAGAESMPFDTSLFARAFSEA